MSKMSELDLQVQELYIEGYTREVISTKLGIPLQIIECLVPESAFTDEEYEQLQQGWDSYKGE